MELVLVDAGLEVQTCIPQVGEQRRQAMTARARPRWSWAVSHTDRLHATTAYTEPGKKVASLCGDVVAVTGLRVAVGDHDPCLGCLTLLHLVGGSPC